MKNKLDLVKEWIRKAENDLKNAKHSIEIRPEPPLDTVCFHAQQCAEKYLKAYLIYNDVEFEKTHDLGELILLATKIDKSFEEILEFGEKLTDYAVDIRYPFTEEPTEEEAREAIEMAVKIKEFILFRLPVKKE